MEVEILKTRRAGVDIPRNRYAAEATYRGRMVVMESFDQASLRTLMMAKLERSDFELAPLTLYEPRLVWMNDDRFVLAGFERVVQDRQVVQYAQSWLCIVLPRAPADPAVLSERDAKRASAAARG